MKTLQSFEVSVHIYQSTLSNGPEDAAHQSSGMLTRLGWSLVYIQGLRGVELLYP